MAARPPPSSLSSHDSDPNSGPYADRPRALQFQEPQVGPFNSALSLPQDFGSRNPPYEDDEVEKQPLTGGNVPAGYYPPAG